MKRSIRIDISTAVNGFIIRSNGDEPVTDNGHFVATSAKDAAKIAKDQIDKALAEKPAEKPADKP